MFYQKKKCKTESFWVCDCCGEEFTNWPSAGLETCKRGWCFKEVCPKCRKGIIVIVDGMEYRTSLCFDCYIKAKKDIGKCLKRNKFDGLGLDME